MAFIPMRYTVEVHRAGGTVPGEYDDHGNPIVRPPQVVEVPAAGWSTPGDEAKSHAAQALGVDLAIELLARAGAINLGETVVLPDDPVEYTAQTRKNFDYGPFGFRPGLDVIGLVARKG